jgi:hypothetical protein
MGKNNTNDDDSNLIEFYKAQWELIHELNNLDWRVALILVPLMASTSFIFGIALQLGIDQVGQFVIAIRATAFVTYLFCIYGLWTVAKGHSHAILKFDTLKQIEIELEVSHFIHHRKEKYPGKGIWETILSRRFVLFVVYSIAAIMSYSMMQIPLSEFTLPNLLRFDVWFVTPIIITLIIIGLYRDHKLHERKE